MHASPAPEPTATSQRRVRRMDPLPLADVCGSREGHRVSGELYILQTILQLDHKQARRRTRVPQEEPDPRHTAWGTADMKHDRINHRSDETTKTPARVGTQPGSLRRSSTCRGDIPGYGRTTPYGDTDDPRARSWRPTQRQTRITPTGKAPYDVCLFLLR